jgi:hypothetical protein
MTQQLEVRWPRAETVVFHGKNGTGLCCGLWLTVLEDKIVLRPITSRGKLANCFIDVPTAVLPQVLAALKPSAGPIKRGSGT